MRFAFSGSSRRFVSSHLFSGQRVVTGALSNFGMVFLWLLVLRKAGEWLCELALFLHTNSSFSFK